ncbi:hypothetical protein DPMN_139662 [Dreissena polymorpha]|uniref:Uncharacterized protein n=1 Tax=Dreissena polymorpha TaxID=45954 RepID=A0A9D4G654_DREPO|nr:hypothetical protein DPMN_139662 [Dreissena polymorpha]
MQNAVEIFLKVDDVVEVLTLVLQVFLNDGSEVLNPDYSSDSSISALLFNRLRMMRRMTLLESPMRLMVR